MSLPTRDPVAAGQITAEQAGLTYISNPSQGITRKPKGRDFVYIDQKNRAVRDPAVLGRIKSLAIPPAWTEVWICPDPHGHLQATGRDARGRKQYRYHPRWRAVRDETKFDRMLAFSKALPRIRARVEQDLQRPGLCRRKVLATLVQLLETSLIRIGNEEYARQNQSFGLTTMRDRHVDVNGSTLRFEFRGKSGKSHVVDIRDPRLARIVSHCQAIPGQELFQYYDRDGQAQKVNSSDVNAYLREIAGEDFTAKDFRTWAGTVLASLALQEVAEFSTRKEAKRNLTRAIEAVAQRLGNTPAICRRCYIHPQVIDQYLQGTLLETLQQRAERALASGVRELRPEEAAVVGLLQQRLRRESLEDQLKASLRRARRHGAPRTTGRTRPARPHACRASDRIDGSRSRARGR